MADNEKEKVIITFAPCIDFLRKKDMKVIKVPIDLTEDIMDLSYINGDIADGITDEMEMNGVIAIKLLGDKYFLFVKEETFDGMKSEFEQIVIDTMTDSVEFANSIDRIDYEDDFYSVTFYVKNEDAECLESMADILMAINLYRLFFIGSTDGTTINIKKV